MGHIGRSPMGQWDSLAVLYTHNVIAFRRHTRGICARVCNTGKKLAQQGFSLRRVARRNKTSHPCVKIHMQSFTCFADALAFRGRSPCVTKRSTHLLLFIVLFHTHAVLFWCILSILWFNSHTGSPARSERLPELRTLNSEPWRSHTPAVLFSCFSCLSWFLIHMQCIRVNS